MDNSHKIFLSLSKIQQKSAIEALIFASEEPLSLKELHRILLNDNDYFEDEIDNKKPTPNLFDNNTVTNKTQMLSVKDEGIPKNFFSNLIAEINMELLETHRPFQIIYVGGGYQFVTRKEYGELIHQLNKFKQKKRLSQASLEVLAIIAYKQPVTKPEVEQIRGVNSGDVINSLMDKNLIEIKGRRDSLGKPLLYGTSKEFLKVFGINSLDELPKLREIVELEEPENTDNSFLEIKIDDENVEILSDITQFQQSHFISFEDADSEIQE